MGLFWFHHSRGQGHGPFVEWVCSWVLRVLRVGECSTITGNSERCESLRWSTVQHEVFKRFGTLVVRKRKPIWWAFFKIPQVWQGCTCPKKVLLPRQLESAISQLHGCTSQTASRCTSWPDLKTFAGTRPWSPRGKYLRQETQETCWVSLSCRILRFQCPQCPQCPRTSMIQRFTKFGSGPKWSNFWSHNFFCSSISSIS